MTDRSENSPGAGESDGSNGETGSPHLTRIARYPIKSLDPVYAESVQLDDGPGAVTGDREYAIVDADRFDHYFRVMINTDVPPARRGARLTVGDPVVVDGVRPESDV